MGNQPSNEKSAGTSPRQADHQHKPPQREASKKDKDHKQPSLPLHNSGPAAPPEASLEQALGSIASQHAKSGGRFSATSSGNATPQNVQTPNSRPVDVRPKIGATAASQLGDKPAASSPVPVPHASSNPPVKRPKVARNPSETSGATTPMSPFSADQMTDLARAGSLTDVMKPPRLPLPISEEVHTPGSPLLAPAENQAPIDTDGPALDDDAEVDENGISRKASNLSNVTEEEDDVDGLRVDPTRPTVPTRLEWLRGGEKVYVTGTIFQWNRKQRLHPVQGRPGAFATTINILPGTHHIRFLVDNNMQTSPDLPTTVDFGNNLVNYIEVSPDDVLPPTPPPKKTEEKDAKVEVKAPAKDTEAEQPKKPRYRPMTPMEEFTHDIPQYLRDWDEDDNTQAYRNATVAMQRLPQPPGLPGFLNKPILNLPTSMKDDNSVLNMPNHTTLNHLATSSIRDEILAVTATTRYKDKYLTTIIYKAAVHAED